MKVRNIFFIILLVSTQYACAPVTVNSSKDPTFTNQLNKVVILHDTATPVRIVGIKGKMNKITSLVSQNLTSKGIQNKIIKIHGETLNKEAVLNNALSEIDTTYVLKVSALNDPSTIKSSGRRVYNNTTFFIDTTLIDSKTKQEKWKSFTPFTYDLQLASEAAKKITGKMLEDKIIGK